MTNHRQSFTGREQRTGLVSTAITNSAGRSESLIIATDGSALGNPGPSGWCWYLDSRNWQAGGVPHGTNNLGELNAVYQALRATSRVKRPLVIECDSKYAISALTSWHHNWRRNGWKNSAGAPVANRELIEAALAQLSGRDVKFVWVKGHVGHVRNEAADTRAKEAATRARGGSGILIGPGLVDF